MQSRSILFLFSILLVACGQPPSVSDQLVNRWNTAAIFHNGEDVTSQHNPQNNRWIELKADGTFVSDGDPYGRNTGKWTLDEDTMELYLDSDAGEGDDSYWIVSIEEYEIRLKGTRSDFTEQFMMVWTQ